MRFYSYEAKMHWEDANVEQLLVNVNECSSVVIGYLTSTERCAMFCPVAVKKPGHFNFADETIQWLYVVGIYSL